MRHVFDVLKMISQRPYMYLGGDAQTDRFELLCRVEVLLFGYSLAVSIHGGEEPVADFHRGFSQWLTSAYRWDLTCGPTGALMQHTSGPEEAWKRFWELVDEYQQHLGV